MYIIDLAWGLDGCNLTNDLADQQGFRFRAKLDAQERESAGAGQDKATSLCCVAANCKLHEAVGGAVGGSVRFSAEQQVSMPNDRGG